MWIVALVLLLLAGSDVVAGDGDPIRASTTTTTTSEVITTTVTGYLMDKQCLRLCDSVPADKVCTPDNIHAFYNPQDHTQWCLLLGQCVESGYVLMSPEPDETTSERSGKRHSILLDLSSSTQGSRQALVNFIQKGPSSGPFPLVMVEYSPSRSKLVDGVIHPQDAIVKDPWGDDTGGSSHHHYYDGVDTIQVLCPDSDSPSIMTNNLCFRSDVKVSLSEKSSSSGRLMSYYIIESNGCPNHDNMQGGTGLITNSQQQPVVGPPTTTGGGGCCSGRNEDCCSSSSTTGCCSSSTGDDKSCCSSSAAGCCSGGKQGCCSSSAAGCCSSSAGCCSGGKQGCCSSSAGCCSATGEKQGCCSSSAGCCSATGEKEGCCSSAGEKEGCCSSSAGCCSATGEKEGCCSSSTGCCSSAGEKEGCCSSSAGCCSSTGEKEGCCSGGKESCCSSMAGDKGEGCCSGKGCCSGCKGCCGSCGTVCGGCGGTSSNNGNKETCGNEGGRAYEPRYQHYTMSIPSNPGEPGEAKYFDDGADEVVGIMSNGVLLDSHKPTWSYDSCNGHSDKKHQYHYHIPPYCFLESMGIPLPDSVQWWINDAGDDVRAYDDMATKFPSTAKNGGSPVIGFARDGYPIFGPYDETGALQRGAEYGGNVDECNGKMDSKGNYGYYLTVDPPFAPPCLRGEKKGRFSYYPSEEKCPMQGIKTTIIDPSSVAMPCRILGDFSDCVATKASPPRRRLRINKTQ